MRAPRRTGPLFVGVELVLPGRRLLFKCQGSNSVSLSALRASHTE